MTRDPSKPFFFLLVFGFVFLMAARTPLDSDLWWHLRSGESTWLNRFPISVDLYSYTRAGSVWVNHSWLFALGLYMSYATLGIKGFTIFVASLAAISMIILYMQLDGHPLMRIALVILGSTVAAPVWSTRPQITSLVMLSMLMLVIYLYKWKKRDFLWIIPLLFIIWSNLHGGYALGFIYFICVLFGEGINRIFNRDLPSALSSTEIRKLIVIMIFAFLAVAINPNGWMMWVTPFQTINVKVLQDLIPEWASPDFHQAFQQPFLFLLALWMVCASLDRKRMDGADLLSVIVFAGMALLARRNFGPFAMVCIVTLSRVLVNLWNEEKFKIVERFDMLKKIFPQFQFTNKTLPLRLTILINTLVLLILLLFCAGKVLYVTSPSIIKPAESSFFPVESTQWLLTHKPDGRIFNSYNWGGYLIWHLREYPVFVDGRTDLFDQGILEDYLAISGAEPGWSQLLSHYDIRVALIEHQTPLAEALLASPDWVLATKDSVSQVFIQVMEP